MSKKNTSKSGTKGKKAADKGDESEHEIPFKDLYIEDLEDMAVNRLIFGDQSANQQMIRQMKGGHKRAQS